MKEIPLLCIQGTTEVQALQEVDDGDIGGVERAVIILVSKAELSPV